MEACPHEVHRPAPAEHRLRVDAQALVIETHGSNQGYVLRRVPSLKVFLGVALGVVHPCKPLAQTDARAQMLRACSRDV